MSVLFLGKANDPYAADAAATALHLLEDVTVFHTAKGVAFSDEVDEWSGEWIISYLCQQVVPKSLLAKASKGAINFHPGPPEYPGVGCTNFALYNGEKEFGVTCHHMAPKVDTGAIVSVRRFPLSSTDSVLSLTKRAYAHMIALFHEIVLQIHRGHTLEASCETWTREPYTRKNLDDLCRLDFNMDDEEIGRRIRAAAYPGMPGPFFTVHGKRFVLEGSKPIQS